MAWNPVEQKGGEPLLEQNRGTGDWLIDWSVNAFQIVTILVIIITMDASDGERKVGRGRGAKYKHLYEAANSR